MMNKTQLESKWRDHSNHKAELARIATGVMLVRGLEPDFPKEVQHQLSQIQGPASEHDPQIRDLRDLLWCSIDNDDSKDLDQITVSETLSGGRVRIWVGVADVDALIKKDTPIDLHALINSRSVYTSARIFPMLPLRLSTNLTSLNPDEDRLAIVNEMVFSADGVIEHSAIYRGWVRNKAQLEYDAISDWIEGSRDLQEVAKNIPGMAEQLITQDKLAQKLRVIRHERGSLEFDMFQPRAIFDGNTIADLQQQAHNRARQLIEEFMIATNGCTAQFLAKKGIYSMRRVVRSPERWLKIVDVALKLGTKLPQQPDSQALENFLAKQHREHPLVFPDLSLVIVKLMGSGEYIVERPGDEAVGHFGLAVTDYMHSTAPNRRYPDLITLRLIKAALVNQKPPYSVEELHELAFHCTSQEDAAKKVERQMRKSEAAMLLHSRIGERFKGVVSGVTDLGTWVRIFQPPAEGKLMGPIPHLAVGDLLEVKLVSTHVQRGFIDFVVDSAPKPFVELAV